MCRRQLFVGLLIADVCHKERLRSELTFHQRASAPDPMLFWDRFAIGVTKTRRGPPTKWPLSFVIDRSRTTETRAWLA